jgi:hypothetical protein
VTRGVSSKHQREDRLRLRRKRLQDASGALRGAKSPVAKAVSASLSGEEGLSGRASRQVASLGGSDREG